MKQYLLGVDQPRAHPRARDLDPGTRSSRPLAVVGARRTPHRPRLATDDVQAMDPRPPEEPCPNTRSFATIVAISLALSLMWFAIDLADDSTGWWFSWPMLGTGLAVVITGVGLFGLGGLFGADWERRQIDRYLERRRDPSSGRDAVP
jgi:hypothetical protein